MAPNNLAPGTGAFTTIYDPGIGYRIRARCSGVSGPTAGNPRLDIELDGTEDDGVILASRFDAGGPPAVVGPTDGDIDAGQTFVMTPAGGANPTTSPVASYSIDFGGRDGETNQARWVGRVRQSDPNAPVPTQGNCTIAGTSIIAE